MRWRQATRGAKLAGYRTVAAISRAAAVSDGGEVKERDAAAAEADAESLAGEDLDPVRKLEQAPKSIAIVGASNSVRSKLAS